MSIQKFPLDAIQHIRRHIHAALYLVRQAQHEYGGACAELHPAEISE